DASLPQSSIEPRIGAPTTGRHVANRRSKRLELLAFLGLRRQRRNFSVRRINDQRRAPRSDDPLGPVPPRLVVGTRDVGLRSGRGAVIGIAGFGGLPFELCRFGLS